MARRYSGFPIKRKEDFRYLTGRSEFVDDIKLPHTLYASFLRSTMAHARIRSIDTSVALSMKGVLKILTGNDGDWISFRPHVTGMKPYVRNALARDKVRFVGEPIAVVLSTDRYIAEDALEKIEVDYEPLKVVPDANGALKSDSQLVHENWGDNIYLHYEHKFGEIDATMEKADLVFSEDFKSARYTGTPIEARAILSSYDPADHMLTIWSSTQMAHGFRSIMSELLGHPENNMRVIAPDVGGAFGIKTAGTPEDVMVCVLSMQTGMPVKWIETRTENLLSGVHCHEIIHRVTAAFTREGKLFGLKTKIIADIGAFVTVGGFEPITHSWYYLPGQYKLPSYAVEVDCVATNKAPFGAVRGFGRVVGAFVIERILDIAAKKLGIDPIQIRMKNTIQPSDFPYTSITGMYLDKNSFVECALKALDLFDYKRWRNEQARLRSEGKYLGIGFSSSLGPSGLSASKTQGLPGYEPVRLVIDPAGKATLYTGVCPHGQGHETILAQLVADELGLELDEVTVIHGDTSSTPYGLGTWSDRSAVAAGSAAISAARQIQSKILAIASKILVTHPDNLEIFNGRVRSKSSPENAISMSEIGRIAYYKIDQLPNGFAPGLEVTSYYDPANIVDQDAQGRRNESPTYSNSTHLAAVEVDIHTGAVKVLKYVVAHDSGFLINPGIVDGIVHGCIAQGLGAALSEELIYDSNGQLVTGTFMDYVIPSADMIPPIELAHLETLSTSTILGFKGAGQSGSMATPAAIANAVDDAFTPFGTIVKEMPLTQSRVWHLSHKES